MVENENVLTTGERIRKYRKEKGLTIKQLGELCGISEANMGNYERGVRNPKKETLEKIANALSINVLLLEYNVEYDENGHMQLKGLSTNELLKYTADVINSSYQKNKDNLKNLGFESLYYIFSNYGFLLSQIRDTNKFLLTDIDKEINYNLSYDDLKRIQKSYDDFTAVIISAITNK
ncbi:MAG: helix-turn-helix domain-containing protein [Erysipelotrichaceae bacterium]|nr:helix-turn-helix domain-containing protein [Erysipelotrichaceae bacterium]